MSTQFLVSRDKSGAVTYGLQPADDMKGMQLQQNVVQNFTVPNEAAIYECIFSIDPGLRVFVAYNGDVADAFPADVADVTSELNPTSRILEAGTQVSLITPDTSAYVGVLFYAK